jgi:hypothetical protein
MTEQSARATTATATPTWTPGDRVACYELLVGFCTGIDAGRITDVAALFTEDCVADLGGPVLHGRSALLDALSARPAGRRTLHLSTNVSIVPDGTGALATSVIVAFVLLDEHGRVDPVPRRISAVTDRLARAHSRWLIAERTTSPLLNAAAPAADRQESAE